MDGFWLAGGTSLALRFGHRVSVDLDFFTDREFDAEELAAGLSVLEGTMVNRAPNSLTLDVEGVKVDALRHAYSALEPVEQIDGVRLAGVRDVAAMKLNAIVGLGAKKDFHDVARLLEECPLEELLGFHAQKYPETDRFVVTKSLAWFDDAEVEPDVESRDGRTWGEVKREIVEALGQLEG
jgi:hypothetical protein